MRTAGIREEYPLNTIGRGVRSRNNVNSDPQACMYIGISDAFPGLVGGRAREWKDVSGDGSGKWWLAEQSLTKNRVVPRMVVATVSPNRWKAMGSERMCGQAGKWWGVERAKKGQRKAALVVVLAAWRCGSALRR